MFWRYVLLIFGVFACSTAVIMIKVCTVQPVLLSAYRLGLAAAMLSPLLMRDLRRYRGQFNLSHLRRTLLPGLVLGAHILSWIIGARKTPAANSSLIVNMVPIIMPFLLYALIRERVTRAEWIATGLSLAGVAVLVGADLNLSAKYVTGDVICFGSMILFASYLALGRRNRDFPSIWLYVVPVYFVGGLLCFAASLFFVSPLAIYTWQDLLLTLSLVIVPTVIGHSILNYSMKHIRGQAVSIANLAQFIFAGVMGFFLLNEVPQWTFYIACVLVVVGAVLALRSTLEQLRSRPD